ncbi:hypothetical protein ABZ896_26910 [Streptomyces sp. NPDC047072]|uniref:hypothetical protein n=1 Tax=Streptomyces sp. NPDC047072 TaxID=3154809 RepID=UPI0033C17522
MGKDRQNSAVHALVAQLVGLTGTHPRVSRESSGIRIEFDVTPESTRQWEQILGLFEQGAAFGTTDTDTGQVAWIRIPVEDDETDPPA